MKELSKLRDEFEIVGDVRGKGLMIGVEMVTDKVKRILLVVVVSRGASVMKTSGKNQVLRFNSHEYLAVTF